DDAAPPATPAPVAPVAPVAPELVDPPLPAPPLVVPRGHVVLRLSLEANLATGAALEPISLAPDVWVGATGRLAIGVTHATSARNRIGAGRGLCLRGTGAGCLDRYGGAAVEARFTLRDHGVELAGHAAIDLRHFRPNVVALEVGAIARWRGGRMTIVVAPDASLGLTNAALDNRATANLPILIAGAATPCLSLEVRSGMRGLFDDFLGTIEVPLALGARWNAPHDLAVGGVIGFPNAAGAGGTFATRVASLYVEWRR
ncbi:MAG: hypothetical protein K8W52_11290, partial [Deltaproteobacteria bacterium]|nr:hypothetical protein [Deltaproteobacteria bacterium]